ncbi:ABC transporter substrate-binding protein [Paenibacillus sp. MMS18-CY102]|uniref:ABC transporter substrate-binding protein n=1 Tax=Paenibacillus sp. MMS18-CY102 TaxID=2682849 RepID=UPI0013662A2B|nr:ABC transporter substrate-binding protein [Paenibacillus sp. MMS18-CY102]MWC31254.1 ABC transporter substrate-binding protein [Paenibacillus sp. MMS18-CY102]
MLNINHYRIKFVSLIAVLLLVTAALAGCGSKDKPAEAAQADGTKQDQISIKIADILSNPVFRVAKSKGLFDKYGIDAKLVTFATPAEGINSLFIKQVDVAYGADFPILNAASKGEYSIIATTGTGLSDESAAHWKLYVRDEIQKPEDLKGKTVSNFRGTFISYLWDDYLTLNHLTLDDVKVVGQGGFDEAYVALKKGEVDAVWAYGAAMISKFEAIEGVHQLSDMSKTNVRTGGDLIAPDSLVKEHPEAIANFIRALDEASQFIKSNPDEVADILYKEVKQPKDATLMDLPAQNWTIGFTKEAFDSLSKQKKYMVDNGVIKDDFDLAGKISLDAVKQAVPNRVTYTK